VVMKSIIFWDMTPCSPLSVSQRFGGTYRLHLLGIDGFILSYGRANGSRVPVFYLHSVSYINPDFRLANYSACHLLACFLLNLFFRPRRWRRYVPPKRRLTLNGLHGVISQKMILLNLNTILPPTPKSLNTYFPLIF
jgi:hypothetical protein